MDWYKIVVTRELLDKNENELSSDELQAVGNYKKRIQQVVDECNKENDLIRKDCKYLCSGIEYTMIPSSGWIKPIKELCYQLECLNYDFKKHGCLVNVSQSKTKYATLRFYYNINYFRTDIFGKISDFIKYFTKLLDNIDYGRVYVIDKPMYETTEWELVKDKDTIKSDAIYVDSKNVQLEDIKNKNVYFKDGDDIYQSYILYHQQKGHVEYKKHKIIRFIYNTLNRICNFISYSIPSFTSKSKLVHREVFENTVSKLVHDCERECEHYCECCGVYLDDDSDDSKDTRCYMNGWYEYLCKRCAVADGRRSYFNTVNKKWYVGDKEIEGKKNFYTGKGKV